MAKLTMFCLLVILVALPGYISSAPVANPNILPIGFHSFDWFPHHHLHLWRLLPHHIFGHHHGHAYHHWNY
ncbi:unnamed protein product [Phyllotreta striolata]|uniref:Uncharacterized protein n=1 Tax=Phyllotreta striolata TaxID=444603 RepID=A0A9N9TKJ3_PHYSR|nr:unnamed protein product [Phyllotreta striolata]